jgi:hypothetical protein
MLFKFTRTEIFVHVHILLLFMVRKVFQTCLSYYQTRERGPPRRERNFDNIMTNNSMTKDKLILCQLDWFYSPY